MNKLEELMTELTVAINRKAEAERVWEAANSYKGVPEVLFTTSDEPTLAAVSKMSKGFGEVKRRSHELVMRADSNIGEVLRKIHLSMEELQAQPKLNVETDAREQMARLQTRVEDLTAVLHHFVSAVEAEEEGPELTCQAYQEACKVLGRKAGIVS